MARPLGGTGHHPLTLSITATRRRFLRGACVAVGVLATILLWRSAVSARDALLAEGDRRVARLAAGYLQVVSSNDRPARTSAEARLLAAAASLGEASFWEGGLQVWLDGTPLLRGDTAGQRAAVATFLFLGDSGRASVGVWRAVPPAALPSFMLVSAGLAVAALVTVAASGEYLRGRRPRALVAAAGLLVLLLGALDQARTVWAVDRATTEATLFRARRILEVAAVGRRLAPAEVEALAGGLVVTPVEGDRVVRAATVSRDTIATSVAAVASLRQAWVVAWPTEERIPRPVWRVLWGLAALVTIMGFIAGALPPAAGYLTSSRSTP